VHSRPLPRRTLLGAAGAAALAGALPARAQTPAPNRGALPQEGQNYVRLAQPLAGASPGRIEVLEFFWYGCPHCNAFEPALEPWVQRLPADVAFRRVPVFFAERPFAAHQRLYYALEATNQLEKLHRRAFYAIHSERQRLADLDEAAAFVARQGGDADAFKAAWDGFAVQTKVQQARTLAAGYKIDAVPAMGVAGRWYTTGPLAAAGGQATGPGGNERMLAVVDHLLERVRQGR
jgi:thiol:disulfide interchange protein DsbA